MKIWLLILLFCTSAFCASATRDTVFVEQITRDTVYIPIKAKTDTVYIKKDVFSTKQTEETCCRPTEDNPFGLDTTKYARNDTNYTHHTFYLHFDLISFLWIIGDKNFTSVGGSLEISKSRYNSIMIGYRYNMLDFGNDTLDIYNGTITQYDIGVGYRHYFRPAKYSFFIDVGGRCLIRKYDYINTWDNTNLINNRPHSRQETVKQGALYLHGGNNIRNSNFALGIEYGIAYNTSSDKELLKEQTSYITSGFQLEFRLNIGVGLL